MISYRTNRTLSFAYFGEGKVTDGVRHWRVRDAAAHSPGWYVFEQAGRGLEVVDSIEPELYQWQDNGLKGPLKGYQAVGRFVGDFRQARLFDLPRDEDLERFTPVTACSHVWGQSKNIVHMYGVHMYGVSQKILTERSWEPCYPDATFTENRI